MHNMCKEHYYKPRQFITQSQVQIHKAFNSDMPLLRVVLGPGAVSKTINPPVGRFGGCGVLLCELFCTSF